MTPAPFPPDVVAPASIGCLARIALFVAVGLFGTLISMVLLYLYFDATGPQGPDSGMGNALGAAMLSPVGGILFGLAALLWQARFDRAGTGSKILGAICAVLALLAFFVFFGLGLFI